MIDQFHQELKKAILRSDLIEYDAILLKRTEWIRTYNEEDKKELILYIQKKDKELMNLLKEKAETIKEQILKEDHLNRNRGIFKLYE